MKGEGSGTVQGGMTTPYNNGLAMGWTLLTHGVDAGHDVGRIIRHRHLHRGGALVGDRHCGTHPRLTHRARRVPLTGQVIGQDHIAWSEAPRGAIANAYLHVAR